MFPCINACMWISTERDGHRWQSASNPASPRDYADITQYPRDTPSYDGDIPAWFTLNP